MPPPLKQSHVNDLLVKLYNGSADDDIIKDRFNQLLTEEANQLIPYINTAFFSNENNLLNYIATSISQKSKTSENNRKIIYNFCGDYISQNAPKIVEYAGSLLKFFFSKFKVENVARTKQASIIPILAIIESYERQFLLNQEIINPKLMHYELVTLLKMQKFTPGVKGQLWILLGTIQGKFPVQIQMQKKRQVQINALLDLKSFVAANKNLSTVASILTCFDKCLIQNLLPEKQTKQLFNHLITLMLPLTKTYDVSITALQVLSNHASTLHQYFMINGQRLFEQCCGLMGHNNNDFKFAVHDALYEFVRQIVKGIQQNKQKYFGLYQLILDKMWNMLKQQTQYKGKSVTEQKYKGSAITILRILGTLTPLIKQYQTVGDVKKFFALLLQKCSRKITKAFDERSTGFQAYRKKDFSYVKYILYSQKQLTSFLSSLSLIIYHLDQLSEKEATQLQKIFLTSLVQYPFFLQKYQPKLVQAMVEFIMAIQSKSAIFNKLLRKIISQGFKQGLDTQKHQVNTDQQYYEMIKRTSKLWTSILTSSKWILRTLQKFSTAIFDFLEYMPQHLDISYKSNIQLDIQEQEQNFDDIQQENKNQDIVQIFFLANETIQMSNIQEYQYLCSLVLIFQQILQKIDFGLYQQRILNFHVLTLERLRIFPKCIPLMKIIRGLNNYLIKHGFIQKLKQEKQNKRKIEQFCQKCKSIYFEITQNHLQKHQQQYLYETLKMLLSMPFQIYFFDDCEILKTNFSMILKKSLQIGQQILSLANCAIQCIKLIFMKNKVVGQRYLTDVIPCMQKFIWLDKVNSLQATNKIYLFLSELQIRRDKIANSIMEFLGSVGGLAHMLVDNQNKQYITWDYQCKVEIQILMHKDMYDINLTKMLNRACFLALNGQYNIKRNACEFLHGVITYVIGKAANKLQGSKQNTANFFDKILPTVLQIASNTSHPSQQLLHTLLIQSIRFFAHTQEYNSPDILTILKHILRLYNGTQDMSCLASKCLAQFVRWHIKSQTQKKASFPVIKVIMRNIWSLVSNRKARDGLILLLIQLLKQIHRQEYLMSQYALQICSIIINIGRCNMPLQKQFLYLVNKLVLSLNIIIKKLITVTNDRDGDKYKKFPTIHSYLNWIYQNCFFSYYQQQRKIAFMAWEEIIKKYQKVLDYSTQTFLRDRADKQKKYLFAKVYNVQFNPQQNDKLVKNLSKIAAMGEVWSKLSSHGIISAQKLIYFNDVRSIFMESYCNMIQFFLEEFLDRPAEQRVFNDQTQKIFINAFKSFPNTLNEFSREKKKVGENLKQFFINMLKAKRINQQNFVKLYIWLLIKPNNIITNFNYDLVSEKVLTQVKISKQNNKHLHSVANNSSLENQNDMFKVIVKFITFFLEHGTLPHLFLQMQALYGCNKDNIMPFLLLDCSLYERQIKMILKCILQLSRHYQKNQQGFQRLIVNSINILRDQTQLNIQRKNLTLQFIISFNEYEVVQAFVLQNITSMNELFHKYQRYCLKFLIQNFSRLAKQFVPAITKQPKLLKLFFLIIKQIDKQNQFLFYELIIQNLRIIDEQILEDCLKIHWICLELNINQKIANQEYFDYIMKIIKMGMDVQRHIDLHILSINLGGLLLGKLRQIVQQKTVSNHNLRKQFDQSLSTLAQLYIPFTISKLTTESQKANCQSYLTAIQTLIALSNDFKFISYLFCQFKDDQIEGHLKYVVQDVIDESVRQCFYNYDQKTQLQYIQWILGFYWQSQVDNKDQWRNFRYLIIQKLFKKVVHFAKLNVLIQIFHKHVPNLLEVIFQPIPPQMIKSMVMQFQIKKGAFSILEHLYMYLPKPQKNKDKQTIHVKEFHKKVIPTIVEIVKTKFGASGWILMTEYDKIQSNKYKSLNVFRQYICSAYNCLLVIFLSTQSKVQHFKSFLFDKKDYLWQNLVDVKKTDYEFMIQTDFKLMKPISTLHKNQLHKKLKNRIKNQYISSSLYIIQEENVPGTVNELQQIKEEPQNQQMQIQNREQNNRNKKDIELEEDIINQHPCMVNLLRVVDFLHENFYDGKTPIWMKSIYEELVNDQTKISVRILLTKLIINRPNIFSQETWAQCLIIYLSQKENGGKFIHYFYRDTVMLLVQFIKKGYKPEPILISSILMKIVKALPHQNSLIYSSNIDIMEELMKIPNVYVEKATIIKMLKTTDATQQKNKYQWRMCATIVMKSCLLYKVPILTEQEWKNIRNQDAKFIFFKQIRTNNVIKLVYELINDNVKKYRIAASGFIGELLKFIYQSKETELQKAALFDQVKQFVLGLYYRQQNRAGKQRFSLTLLNIIQRFPRLISEYKVFSIMDGSLIKYSKEERCDIIKCAIMYINYIFNLQNKIYEHIPQLMMTIRSNIQKFINDSKQVYEAIIQMLKFLCKPFMLNNYQIFQSYCHIYQTLEQAYSQTQNQMVAKQYYQILLQMKMFLSDQSNIVNKKLVPQQINSLKEQIQKTLVKGLGNKHVSVRKTILAHFQNKDQEIRDLPERIIDIFKNLYVRQHENLWLVNVIPLIFSIAQSSSDYKNYLFSKPIQETAKLYDWDFRQLNFKNSSQPYTPIFSIIPGSTLPNKNDNPGSVMSSLGSNRLNGMIRATQNSYMSQEDQVFTLLASQGSQGQYSFFPSLAENGSQSQEMRSAQTMASELKKNYSNFNDIFKTNKRGRGAFKFLQTFKNKNQINFSSAVSNIGNKIRFKKKDKTSSGFYLKAQKKDTKRTQIKTSHRSYKLGQLPNIQISLQNILDPLIQICYFDRQLSSQLFVIFFIKFMKSQDQEKRKKLKQYICQLLEDSSMNDFGFISTLQKCLITLCTESNQKVKINMKNIAFKSNTYDYAIVFTQENLIQNLRPVQVKQNLMSEHDQYKITQWCDLIDLYQVISEHSVLPPLLKKVTTEDQYKKLSLSLNEKRQGKMKQCKTMIEEILENTKNQRLQSFLQRQKLDCLALLGKWSTVSQELQKKAQNKRASLQQNKLLIISLLNNQRNDRQKIIKKISFPEQKYNHQKALLALFELNFDKAQHFSNKALQYFNIQFKKTSSYDFNTKHEHLQVIQKIYEMRQFLSVVKKRQIKTQEYMVLFDRWAKREPNDLYDSNITWVELTQTRIMFSRMFQQRYTIPKKIIAKANTDYLIQLIGQMIKRGNYSYAEGLTRKALQQNRKSEHFNWDFYEAIGGLKLLQLKKTDSIQTKNYELIPALILKELPQRRKNDPYSNIKYMFIQNDYFQCYIDCNIKRIKLQKQFNPDILTVVQKTNQIYVNYGNIKKAWKLVNESNTMDKSDLQDLKCKIHFQFSLFLQKVLSQIKGKFQIKEIKQSMEKKGNLTADTLSQVFVEELIDSISLMNAGMSHFKKIRGFNYNVKEVQDQKIFSLILKLLKIVQVQHRNIGKYFSQAINDKKLPIWIFLYFIPQIIKTLNSSQLVTHFQDLFHSILTMYPEALVYHFNCSYQRQIQCLTPFCKQLFKDLHQKQSVNYKFIDGLQQLHHPQMRLRQTLHKFSIPGQTETALDELQEMITPNPSLGKYNNKFVADYKKKIELIINLKRDNKNNKNKAELATQIQKVQKTLDVKSKQVANRMKGFSKMSDGSLFFQDYNSNDWNRIQVPGTIYCKFQEPVSWNKVYIQNFDLSFITLNSIRKPKKITLYGSNQKIYMLLVKGGEDVRLDQRIEELFELVNRILKSDPLCSKKNLQIKRFQVIPIKKMLGVFQWVDESQTLRNFLDVQFKEMKPGMYSKDNPYDLGIFNKGFQNYNNYINDLTPHCRDLANLYKNFLAQSAPKITCNLQKSQAMIPYGLLRKALQKLSNSFDSYLHIKNTFLSNYAVSCIVTYVLGIGDRHLDNFLIHAPTGSVVMIDFGYSFGSGVDLAIPQLIPFRLTKCFTQLMDPIGYEGIFKQTMISSFEALQKKSNLIVDYCDVFIDDPLMQWVWNSKKQLSSFAAENVSFSISQQPPQKKIFSKKIDYVQNKLTGYHPRRLLLDALSQSRHKQAPFFDQLRDAIWTKYKGGQKNDRDRILQSEQLVQELIQLAIDKNILGRSYIGLNPYV